jgi:hypothetical protein
MTDAQKHHIRQLHKATEIIRDDPDTLSPIDRQRLRLDLLEFQNIVGMGTHYPQTDGDVSQGVPERCVKEMVEGLRAALAKLAKGDYPVDIDMEPKNVHIRVHLRDATTPFWVHVNLELGRDSAIYALFRHFEGSGLSPDRVRRCPRESCGNIFVLGSHARADRMRYCSVKCSRYAATLAYRERKVKKLKRKRGQKQVARLTRAKREGRK